MARRTLDSRPTVRSEGGLLPPELLDRITDPREKDLPGLDPSRDYGLEPNVRLTEAAARSWEHAKAYWGAFKARLESSRPGAELGITRQQWLVPLLAELGFDDLEYRQQPEDVNGRPFHVSHRATSESAAPPLHLVAANQPLDKADPSAPGQKASPHGFLQSYLNETDHLWGIVSNGRQLRILRDNASLTRPAYLEFDLEGMMEGGVFSDFTLLWLVAHRSRLPSGAADTDACFLEQWYKAALVRGARALGDLRLGVENAIRALGQGFLDHPENEALREKLAAGDLDDVGYYRQLLRVVYRLLFLLVAEERDLIFPTGPSAEGRGREIYNEHYSVSRLRERLRLDRGDNRHDDLWRAQRVAFDLLRAGNANLGLPALGGGIFDTRMCPDLEAGQLRNDALKAAVRGLSLAPTKSGYRRINYRDLDVEELGSVYESLLDEQPSLRADGTRAQFTLASGGERKTTGSYYTPSVLVQELLRSALDPVIQQALASAPDIPGKRAALLDLAVCDPACGSGHFLLGAARRIGRELARLASGEHEPDPAVLRHSIREAITHCVYGVDLNPLAVDLCRLALWLEGHEPGRPLGFLDHHIKCGNSLVGATAELIEKGIPTAAFEPVEGDSKDVAKDVKKQNRQELEKPQLRLFETAGLEPAGPSAAEAKEARAIAEFEEDAPEDVLLKEEEYGEFAAKLAHKKRAADLWTAAFFWPLRDESPAPPTQSTLLHHRAGRTQEMGNAFERQLARVIEEVRPFHWELEFPEVFDERKGGFDCMLGNPPWEKVKLSDKEFFATRAPEVANAPNAAARKRLIEQMEREDPGLGLAYEEARALAERTSFYLRQGGRFPLGGAGDVNYYVVFAELLSDLVSRRGQSGILCPSGIATDDTTKALFGKFAAGRIASLYDFENRDKLFEGIDSRIKFCLLTVRGWTDHDRPADFAFFSTSIDHLREPDRHFTLTAEDFALFNPNTLTCPVFRSKRDAEIAGKMYQRAGVFWKEARGAEPEENPWGVKFSAMFHMSNDSGLFRTREELERDGYALRGNVFVHADGREYLPLYEAKLFHQYDHRFATFDGASKEDLKAGNARDMSAAEKENAEAIVIPRYWVPADEVAAKLDTGGGDTTMRSKLEARSSKLWRLAFRQIVRATDERTGVWDVIPTLALGHSGAVVSIVSSSAASPERPTSGQWSPR
ncbi:MAG: N-6 DNA methylase [Dehalococcoidia bacterium]|nr:N-6 DNA methylase [Dehalococcoidia bacterium]